MKKVALIALALLSADRSMADLYQFSVSDLNMGNIVIVKDCLDYNFCGGSGASLAGGNPDYRMHTYIELNEKQLNQALQVCNFKGLGIQVSIQNLTRKSNVTLPGDNGVDMRISQPTVFMKKLSQDEKMIKYKMIQSLINEGNRIGALNAVIAEYGLSLNGYELKLGGNMSQAAAVTDHNLKQVKVSDSAFQHPCSLIETVRHELEHVAQIAKVGSCISRNDSHNLSDHISRERSAYLNDIRNVPEYCVDEEVSRAITLGTIDIFFNHYANQRQ